MERDLQLCPRGVRGGGPDGGLTMTGGGEQEQETEIWPGQLISLNMLGLLDKVAMKNVQMTIKYQIMHVMFILLLYKFLTGSALQWTVQASLFEPIE